MRFAYVAAIACFLTGTGIFLACTDDTPVTPPPGTSTSSSSGDSGKPGTSGQVPGDDDDSHTEEDGGPLKAPDGCLIHCTENLKAGTAKSEPRPGVAGGGIVWQTPEGAISEDSAVATVTLEDGQESANLVLSDYKFDIPKDKATWGIIVELKRQSLDAGIRDSAIEVILDTKDIPRTKIVGTDWPRLISGVHHYGAEVDTWGTDLNPININVPTFGARISAKRNPGVTGPVFGKVDSVKIQVCTTTPPPSPECNK